jgi:hypothetical protein
VPIYSEEGIAYVSVPSALVYNSNSILPKEQ